MSSLITEVMEMIYPIPILRYSIESVYFNKLPNYFPKCMYHLAWYSHQYEMLSCSTCFPALGIWRLIFVFHYLFHI